MEVPVVAGATARGRRGGAKERAYNFVKAQIITGEFPGGELISEGEVATALGVSRTPVREGFLKLETEGLLRLYPQRGALVVPVSPGEVRSVLEARLVLERFAVDKVVHASAARRAEVVETLVGEIDRQRAAARTADLTAFLDADRTFHTALLSAASNPFLTDLYGSLRDRQMRMIGESTLAEADCVATIVAEHVRIADALRSGDAVAALDAVSDHLTGTVTTLGLADQR